MRLALTLKQNEPFLHSNMTCPGKLMKGLNIHNPGVGAKHNPEKENNAKQRNKTTPV